MAPSFDRLYRHVVINYAGPPRGETVAPGTYLVICVDNSTVVNRLQPLLEWRERKGLPVYLATYIYNNQTYQVMVNGQTGTISGQRPVDWLKVWLAVFALIAPGLTVGIIGLMTLAFYGDSGFFVGVIGFILLVIGLIIAFTLVRKAQRMDDV